MSSQPASQGAAKPQSAETAQSEKAQNLSAPLEEDDEFEEFPVEGMRLCCCYLSGHGPEPFMCVDDQSAYTLLLRL